MLKELIGPLDHVIEVELEAYDGVGTLHIAYEYGEPSRELDLGEISDRFIKELEEELSAYPLITYTKN